MNLNTIPRDLKTIIDSEPIDFLVKGKKNHSRKTVVALLLFAVFWLAFSSIFAVPLFGPLLRKEEVHFSSKGKPVVATLDNLGSLWVPGGFTLILVVIGIVMLIWGIVIMFQKGGYFVGTETRFIKYRKGTVVIKDWEQFSGNIKIKKKSTYGNLQLELRTGKISKGKNKSGRFVPDVIDIVQVDNVFEIEKKCRARIQENDPNSKITKDKKW